MCFVCWPVFSPKSKIFPHRAFVTEREVHILVVTASHYPPLAHVSAGLWHQNVASKVCGLRSTQGYLTRHGNFKIKVHVRWPYREMFSLFIDYIGLLRIMSMYRSRSMDRYTPSSVTVISWLYLWVQSSAWGVSLVTWSEPCCVLPSLPFFVIRVEENFPSVYDHDLHYKALLSKALYNIASHSPIHTCIYTQTAVSPTATVSSSGAVGVGCLAQGHLDTWLAWGSNQQPLGCQKIALSPESLMPLIIWIIH